MKLSHVMKKALHLRAIQVLFLLSLALWCLSFKGFLTGTSAISSDASAYGEHFLYYLDNITRGIYPMWEPTRNYGVPTELFLRRIGSFNPLIFLVAIIHSCGVPFFPSYLIFLCLYYLLAMGGFYLIAKRLFGDTNIAFLAYLLLLFSSLGTRLFDSYIIFMFVPMVWFFYFLIAFSQEPRKIFFLGMTYCLMNSVTTYIPFYFLIIVLSFLPAFALVYCRELKSHAGKYLVFFRKNRLFFTLCLLLVGLSLLPGIAFYLDASKAEIAMPYRNYNWSHTQAPADHVLAVDIYNITKWGIAEDVLFSSSFSDLKDFRFAVLYLPLFAYLALFLSFLTRITKKLLVFYLWAAFLFIMVSPHFPVYQYLYDHVFFFKLFRNLHFFLWVALLPLFVLFIVEQFKNRLTEPVGGTKNIMFNIAFVVLVHFGLLLYFLQQEGTLYSSYSVVIISLIFFVFHFSGWLKLRGSLFAISLLILVALQPLEVYHYFNRNTVSSAYLTEGRRYGFLRYEKSRPYRQLKLPVLQKREELVDRESFQGADGRLNVLQTKRSSMYIAQKWIIFLTSTLNLKLLFQYASHPLILYDNIQWVDDENFDINAIGQSLLNNDNLAYVRRPDGMNPGTSEQVDNAETPPKALSITRDSPEVQVLHYDVNSLTLRTNLASRKFLVYNDSYHSKWNTAINGKPAQLYRANVGFKGLWVPQGENTITFRFGAWWEYVLNYALLAVFAATFCVLTIMSIRHMKRKMEEGEAYEGG